MIKPLLDNSCDLIERGYRVMVTDQGGELLLVTTSLQCRCILGG